MAGTANFERRKRKRKRGQKSTNVIAVLLVLLLSLTLSAILVAVLAWKVQESKREPLYETVSMSEEAAAHAYLWLSQIEDMPLSYAEIKQLMGEIHLTLVLTPTEEKGRYTRTLAQGSVADCQNRAQAGLKEAYREVVRYRCQAAGYEEELTDAMLEALMQETYGISVSEYLASCKVQLLPTQEELEKTYQGEVAYE